MKRNPRRKVVRERYVCERIEGIIFSRFVCDLECGHTVEGIAGWGRRTCRQCAEGVRDA